MKSLKTRWKADLKYVLTRLGTHMSPRALGNLNGVVNYLEVGNWMKTHGFGSIPLFADRYELFRHMAASIADADVLYLEFGVAFGASIRFWSKLLRNPNSKLHGFDSFEGLPTTWIRARPKGHFSTGGNIPDVDDPRVQFFKGWFEDTLPGYVWPPHDRLVINLDADLYSSTAFVLTTIRQRIQPGSLLYFDEFNHRGDELRAFDEFIETSGFRFKPFGATRGFAGVTFERVD